MININWRIMKVIGDEVRTFNEIYEMFADEYGVKVISSFLENLIAQGVIRRSIYRTEGGGTEILYTRVREMRKNEMQPVIRGQLDKTGKNPKDLIKILQDLREWGKKNLPEGDVRNSFDLVLADILRLQRVLLREVKVTKQICSPGLGRVNKRKKQAVKSS